MEFREEVILICLVRARAQDAMVMLGIGEVLLCRLLGQPVINFRGSLELSSRGSLGFGSLSETEGEREAPKTDVVSSSHSGIQGGGRKLLLPIMRVNWYEMDLMDEQGLDQSSQRVSSQHEV